MTNTNIEKNELELINGEVLKEDENFLIVKTPDNKFKRKAKYKYFSSLEAVTKEQKKRMFKLLNDSDGEGEALPAKENIGVKFKLVDVIHNPYDSIDEDTGERILGVITYLFSETGEVYVTSSKSVYHTLQNIFTAFGEPHYSEDDALDIAIVEKKGEKFKYIDVSLV